MDTAVNTCPKRMDAADAEAPRPPRIGTAVEFWSGMETTADLTMRRFFWCTRKKIQDRTLFLLFFLPESSAVDNCPERMDAAAPRPPRIETAVVF